MSLLDKASLIITPNAYKASKLYSVIPSNGDGDMTVVRATTATRVNEAGLIEGVASNVPRVDYTGGGCPSILVEPQRTNLLTYSEQFDDGSWAKVGVTVTLGSQVSPKGIASTFNISNTTLGDSYLQKQGLPTTAGNYTMSVFMKNIDNLTNTQLMGVHLTEGSVTSQLTYTWSTNTFTLSGTNAISGSSTLYANGWVRLSFTYSIGALTDNHWARLYSNSNLSVTKSALIYGAQLEAGSYPTSYIPTVASSVTRNVDVISKTGISSLINSEEGVLFVEMAALTSIVPLNNWLTITNGTNSNSVGILFETTGKTTARIESGGVTQAYITISGDYSISKKLAFKWKVNDFAFWIDGVEVGSDTSGITFSADTLNSLQLNYGGGGNHTNGKVKQIQIYKEALTDEELTALTAL